MNLWKCEARHCNQTVVGIGGAIGLIAIGWYFKNGDVDKIMPPTIFCPTHHPEANAKCSLDYRCGVCKKVERIQKYLKKVK